MNKIFKLTTIARSVPFLVIALISPSIFTLFSANSVKAGNQFDVCLNRLVDSGVTLGEAQTACASALLPKELSSCVSNITRNTDITGIDALQNCYQVRRPIEMGDCVVSINKRSIAKYSQQRNESQAEGENTNTNSMVNSASMSDNQEYPVMLALSTCRKSLLPARHSQCVISLSGTSERISPIEAMTTCLKAEDFPRDLFPSY